jgi:DNA invertase Pin-like site-specific DNA recombinase
VKAAGYVRVSTDEQAEHGVSMDEMRRQILERIEERGWQLHEIYSDVLSGSRADRRGLQAMLAAREEFDVLVVWNIDRLGRDFTEQVAGVAKLREAGVALEVIKGPVDLETPEGKAQFGMRAVFAEYERDTIIGRNRMAAEAIAREGRYNGPRPTGYTFDEHHRLQPVPHEVQIVRRVFAEFCAGQGFTAIAKTLNAERVPTKRGGKWRVATVREMLANPLYIGKVRFRGEIRDGIHNAIIDWDTWARTQALIEAQAISRGRGRGRHPKANHLFVRGLLRCGICGEAMVPRTPTHGRPNYLCGGHQVTGCEMPIAYRDEIDQAVFNYFEQVGLDLEATRETLADARDRKLAEVRELLAEAGHEQRRAEDRLARVRRDYQDGKLDAEDWREQRQQLAGELDAAAAEAQRLHDQEVSVSQWAEFTDLEEQALEHLTEIRRAVAGEVHDSKAIESARAALAQVFERFVLHRADSESLPRRLHAELSMVGESGFVIEPIVREQAIAGYSESMRPVLHREPLQRAKNKERQGVGYRLLDG